MSDVTLGNGVEGLREFLLNGKTSGIAGDTSNGNETFTALMKGLAGDYKIKCTPDKATPLVSELKAGKVSFAVDVSLESNDGEIHSWYNGPVKIAIAEDDTGAGCEATINPEAGAQMMTNGHLTVTVTMAKATWTATKKATLTVSDPDNTGFGGWTAADATFVATVTADE